VNIVTNFAEFSAALQVRPETEFTLLDEEVQFLHNEIDTWEVEKFDKIVNALEMYGISNVPLDLLKKLCKEYLCEVALEVFHGDPIDTIARENILGALVQELKIGDDWPTYGTNSERAEEFYANFAKTCAAYNITFER
jgi:hypothetical protein